MTKFTVGEYATRNGQAATVVFELKYYFVPLNSR
jgi:hypothetical protein